MFYFLLAVGLSLLFSWLAIKISFYFKILDKPNSGRHIHSSPIPLLGGWGIFLSFWMVVIFFIFNFNLDLTFRQLFFLFLGSLIVMLLGLFDDLYKISPKKRFFISILAIFIVLLGGMNFDGITNPFGGTIGLDFWSIKTSWGHIMILADLLVFVWLLGMMYSTKILDGLDGLSVGIVIIGALMISIIASTSTFFQPDIKLLSLIFVGSCLGFWWWNFYPAKIFLGEGGSMFIGLVLGFLAVVSGGKIATALLVMAIPILDLGRVIYKRYRLKKGIFEGDKEHLHFKLLNMGLTHKQAVLFFYLIAFLFGISTLILTSLYKIVVLGFLFLGIIFFEILVNKKYRNI